jgi:glutamyl/glutaminyl-tRNA synthetase
MARGSDGSNGPARIRREMSEFEAKITGRFRIAFETQRLNNSRPSGFNQYANFSMLRSRIAPTPSGFLHAGNALNFLLTDELVRQSGGRLRLRIDDLDSGRVRAEYLQDIFESLVWLRIQPDEGPVDPADHAANYSQQLRLSEYDGLLRRLVESGRVFACSCTRSEVARSAVNGQYAGTCRERKLDLNAPDVVWRFRTEPGEITEWNDGIAGLQRILPHETVRDFAVRRRDGIAAYHVASLSDDLRYGVNLIVRGADLLDSTAAQLLLARVLGERGFMNARFLHHPLLKDPAGIKLSKSAGSDSLKAMREAGLSVGALRTTALEWIGGINMKLPGRTADR